MTSRLQIFAGMTASELKSALVERAQLRGELRAMHEQLDNFQEALYLRLDIELRGLLGKGTRSHAKEEKRSESQHLSERDCQRWQISTLRKILIFAQPPGIDMEALEHDLTYWKKIRPRSATWKPKRGFSLHK